MTLSLELLYAKGSCLSAKLGGTEPGGYILPFLETCSSRLCSLLVLGALPNPLQWVLAAQHTDSITGVNADMRCNFLVTLLEVGSVFQLRMKINELRECWPVRPCPLLRLVGAVWCPVRYRGS